MEILYEKSEDCPSPCGKKPRQKGKGPSPPQLLTETITPRFDFSQELKRNLDLLRNDCDLIHNNIAQEFSSCFAAIRKQADEIKDLSELTDQLISKIDPVVSYFAKHNRLSLDEDPTPLQEESEQEDAPQEQTFGAPRVLKSFPSHSKSYQMFPSSQSSQGKSRRKYASQDNDDEEETQEIIRKIVKPSPTVKSQSKPAVATVRQGKTKIDNSRTG